MDSRPPRLRRSVLYVPGSNPRALAKTRDLPADGLILDLEDAVLPATKAAARDAVLATVRHGGLHDQEIAIRINAAGTPWHDADIEAAACSGADAIVVPKVDAAQTIRTVAARLDALGAPATLALWVMAETPRGVLALADIGAASERLTVVVMGGEDLASAMRLPGGATTEGLAHAIGHCLLAARARGLDILDGVYTNLADPAGFAASCRHGKALGFDGRTLIHPGQIDTANRVYGISAAEAAADAGLVAAWEEAAAAGQGIAVLGGRMVETLHAEAARRRLALHRMALARSQQSEDR